MLTIVSAHLEGSERKFDDFGVFHCSGAHSFVGLVLTAGQIYVNVKILDSTSQVDDLLRKLYVML